MQEGESIVAKNNWKQKLGMSLIVPIVIVLMVWTVDHGATRTRAHGSAKRDEQQLSTPEKHEAEQRLWDLGYWAGRVDGQFDSDSRHALIAFQKVEERPRTGKGPGEHIE